jgi:hypothetical protein
LTVRRYLIPSDYSAADSWRLVEWCRKLGADEFTVDISSADDRAADILGHGFLSVVTPISRGTSIRERMSGPTADDMRRETQLWALNGDSISALMKALPDGLFEYDPLRGAWLEDPVIYRGGELMLGVLSHEAFAVLRLSDDEAAHLAEAGFPSHDSLPRIG